MMESTPAPPRRSSDCQDVEQWMAGRVGTAGHLECCDLLRRRYQNDYIPNDDDHDNLDDSVPSDRPPIFTRRGGSLNRETDLRQPTKHIATITDHNNSPSYSETLFTTSPKKPPRAINNINNNSNKFTDDRHYQVPQPQARSLTSTPYHTVTSAITPLNEELNQLIEAKRKRTLMLLRAKEAPRASVELTSQTDDPSSHSLEPPPQPSLTTGVNDLASCPSEAIRVVSPAASDYDNLSDHIKQQQQFVDFVSRSDEPSSDPLATVDDDSGGDDQLEAVRNTDKIDVEDDNVRALNSLFVNRRKQSPDDKSEHADSGPNEIVSPTRDVDDVISPSESQNFNTLSLVSDILGDFSQDDNSLVQQLSQEDQQQDQE